MHIEDPFERLKRARQDAGYATASAAARAMDIKVVTYTAHENGGRDFGRLEAITYAKFFNVDPAWLMFGDDARGPDGGVPAAPSPPATTEAAERTEAVTREPAGNGWEEITAFFSDRLVVDSSNMRLLEVRGDSMYDPLHPNVPGSLHPGDHVLYDVSDMAPTPPGAFVVDDGVGLSIKIIEAIPQTSPQRVRIGTRNVRYATYECLATEARIVGRVKAKISIMS